MVQFLFITLLHSPSSFIFFNLGSLSLRCLSRTPYNFLFSRFTCPAVRCSSNVSASDLHFTDHSSFSLALYFHSCTDTRYSTPPPTPATHRHTFLHSCKPVFYISPAAATQCKHYAHADTRALSIRRGLQCKTLGCSQQEAKCHFNQNTIRDDT